MNATEACIALNMLPTVGPVRLRKLLEVFKEPQQILAAKRGELRQVEGIGNEVADQISNWKSTVDLAAELRHVSDFGATVITQESSSYPKSLREIHAPPIVLYVWGELEERDHHAIGIIGARRTTHYGLESAKKLAYQLAYAGLTVISGLARGIDRAARFTRCPGTSMRRARWDRIGSSSKAQSWSWTPVTFWMTCKFFCRKQNRRRRPQRVRCRRFRRKSAASMTPSMRPRRRSIRLPPSAICQVPSSLLLFSGSN